MPEYAFHAEQVKKTGTAPSDTPVTLAEAKSQLNVTFSDDDTYIGALIDRATDYAERVTGRSLVIRSWELLTDFPNGSGPDAAIELPINPVQSITSVKYYDTDNVQQTLATASYYSTTGDHAVVYPSGNVMWPDTEEARLHPVTVTFTAGYDGTADSPVDLSNIPAAIKAAILLHVAHMYENREAVNVGNIVTEFPLGYGALIEPYTVRHF